VRLAAIHSFFHYVALREPSLVAVAQACLGHPSKRFTRTPVDFLSRSEAEALLAAPDQNTWSVVGPSLATGGGADRTARLRVDRAA